MKSEENGNRVMKLGILITISLLFFISRSSSQQDVRSGSSAFNKCKSSCTEMYSLCSQMVKDYPNLMQCTLDMSDCKEQCYRRRLDTIQMRLALAKAKCRKKNTQLNDYHYEIVA